MDILRGYVNWICFFALVVIIQELINNRNSDFLHTLYVHVNVIIFYFSLSALSDSQFFGKLYSLRSAIRNDVSFTR